MRKIRTIIAYNIVSFLGILVLTLFVLASASAQDAPDHVVITFKAQRVVRADTGVEKLYVVERAMPGEIIQYNAMYRNEGKEAVRHLKPTIPIPMGLELIPNSARPRPAEASLDGKVFEPLPLMRQVRLPSGLILEEAVPCSEYRALRWDLGGLNSGEVASVSVRARLALN